VVARGGVVLFDDGEHIEGEHPEVVDAAADARTARATAAVGVVVGDGAAGDGQATARADQDTAAEAVTRQPAEAGVTAIDLVVRDGAAGEGDGTGVGRVPREEPGGDREAAAPAVAAVGPRAAGTAEGLIVAHGEVG